MKLSGISWYCNLVLVGLKLEFEEIDPIDVGISFIDIEIL